MVYLVSWLNYGGVCMCDAIKYFIEEVYLLGTKGKL